MSLYSTWIQIVKSSPLYGRKGLVWFSRASRKEWIANAITSIKWFIFQMLVLGSFPTGRGQSPRNSYSNQTLLKSRSGAVLLLQGIHLHKSAAQQARNIIEKYSCMGMQGYWLSLSSAVSYSELHCEQRMFFPSSQWYRVSHNHHILSILPPSISWFIWVKFCLCFNAFWMALSHNSQKENAQIRRLCQLQCNCCAM